jgi:hypothetical protein
MQSSGRISRVAAGGTLLAALMVALAGTIRAHTIAEDVAVQAFVKPSGDRLYLVLRVPINAMHDTEFPQRGPGYLDLPHAGPSVAEGTKLWIADAIEMYEGDARLPSPQIVATQVSLASDRSFGSYQEALAHITGPRLPDNTEVYWDQVFVDALLEYPIHSDRSAFSIHPGFAQLGLHVVTALRFLPPSGVVRAYELLDDPGLVRLDPRWTQAALRFVQLGFLHILDGTDHLLFLFCLVIPFRRFRALVPIVTAFTVAHSFTLIASAYNMAPNALWFPPLIETLIATSILYMALENIVGSATVHRRWMIAFGFGLVHGFGFSFALRQTLQFAGSHLLASLLSFNVGVELGQLLVLALLIPALDLLFKYVVAERMGTIILSAMVAHTAWHWMIDRYEVLRRFPFEWPALDAGPVAMLLRWLMLLVILAGLVWLVAGAVRHRAEQDDERKAARAR